MINYVIANNLEMYKTEQRIVFKVFIINPILWKFEVSTIKSDSNDRQVEINSACRNETQL